MESGDLPSQLPRGCCGYDVGKAKIYDTKNMTMNNREIKCSMCSFILRDPCQIITCGHRYCKTCIDQLTNEGEGPYFCLVDKEKFEKYEVRKDKGCLRDIKLLEVDCPMDRPCKWRGKILDVEMHRGVCPNKLTDCALGCSALLTASEVEAHIQECPKRLSTCNYCKKSFPFDALQKHCGMCLECPISCDFCQKELSARKQLTTHLEEDCEECRMQCHYPLCDFKGCRSKMVQHLVVDHLIQTEKKLLAENDALRKDLLLVKAENKTLRQELNESKNAISDLQAQQNNYEASLKSIIEQLDRERDGQDLGLVEDSTFSDAVEMEDPNDFYNVSYSPPDIHLVSHPYEDLSRFPQYKLSRFDHERAYSFSPGAELSRMKQDVEVVQSTVRKLHDIVQNTHDNQTRNSVAIDEIHLRQDVLDLKTTNGILIWKIPDIRRRYRDAVDRRTISLYSPPFYTSPHGYRMCIRTYLNGDGIGKGTHVSLFFVVMRSEHDNLLPWPFKQSVRFTLINQKNPPASITEAFVPDLKSPSFHKPENDMNIASGFPKFARQSVLNNENFTLGNMIYIKCQVDLTGLPQQ